MPTQPQIILLLLGATLLALRGIASFLLLKGPNPNLRNLRIAFAGAGLLCAVAVLVWHNVTRGSWMPIGDNFDALIWLAVLLILFLAYVQATRPLLALDGLIVPIVLVLMLGAAVLGRTEFKSYVGHTWTTVHRITAYGGFAAFAVAAAAGILYVRTSGLLRRKQPVAAYLGSLERLEQLTKMSVTLGFALLSIGIVTGLVELVAKGRHTPPLKVALAGLVWLIYAVVLHAPVNPVLRGRRAAVLSVVGFVVMVAALLAAQMM